MTIVILNHFIVIIGVFIGKNLDLGLLTVHEEENEEGNIDSVFIE